jgi:cytochrome P450
VVLNQTASIPFSAGPRSCVGKTLATKVMCVVVASVVQRFDIQVAPGYDLNRWEEELEDYFLFSKGTLPVVLTERA